MGQVDELGPLLRRLRRTRGWTLEELAERSGVSDRALSNLERGRSLGPQARTVEALADALHLGAEERDRLSAAAAAGRPRSGAVPAPLDGLPPDVPDFTGRARELATVAALLEGRDDLGHPHVVVVSGTAGQGKTSFAVHAAHRLAGRFPDGRLFLGLRGLDPDPVSPEQALVRLLRGLGVPERRIPVSAEEKAQLFQRTVADRAVLLVLDNAAYEAQVRALLPTSGASFALVTSRRALTGVEHAERLVLGSLEPVDAGALLAGIAGPRPGSDELAALAEVARLCGGMPLALRIAGNRLRSRPGWTAATFARRLADEDSRLQRLTAGDLGVEGAFMTSYDQLSPQARQTFRLLALVPGPDFSAGVAAAVTDLDLGTVEPVLDELLELGLLHPVAADRYGFHDLLHLYARVRLQAETSAVERADAGSRLTAWLLRTAVDAGRWFEPSWAAAPPRPDPRAPLPDATAAQGWLESEGVNWLPALRTAAAAGDHARVVEVAEAMHWFSDRWVFWGHWDEVFTLSLVAARGLGDPHLEVVHLNYLAWAQSVCLGRHELSLTTSAEAAALARRTGDDGQAGWALTYAAFAASRLADPAAVLARVTEAGPLFAAAGDREGASQARLLAATALLDLGRPAAAAAAAQELLVALTDPGQAPADPVATSTAVQVHRLLGRLHEQAGRPAVAAAAYRAALAQPADAISRWVEGLLRLALGRVLPAAGDVEGGRSELLRAHALFTDVGSPERVAEAERLLADEPAPPPPSPARPVAGSAQLGQTAVSPPSTVSACPVT
ncbi:NB-ARC domain-containing protein [Friedmanniella luteola]|uniref:NB-ARC domain-containing protein n=1 Tax=Friedmanniella luteola TaxID=546871 RepID=A0A1H1ZGR6_9ACTN|nr:helix-turn-helix domain-containing protein [Friedmanniella luteola]SDT32829.1 NB-ARC domain-containing protein [Friedmanniella luteola]